MEVILSKKVSIGFPVMRVESGEKRVFLPDFISKLAQIGFEVGIEKVTAALSICLLKIIKRAVLK